ncbi:rab11 family-interacting protein 1-like isoform X2 [Carassius carassius]|uniref:rab11 family-interacting protein 1-like isoform X2 n=1 Tax=Carassius carassius TaxID=217509 RepID=UPI002868F8C0|nr:rab11 family-interacting protein 1-like isoform X2 [Carassius carassius]
MRSPKQYTQELERRAADIQRARPSERIYFSSWLLSLRMSLGDQQWYPTSVQVTVLKARNLRIKGKNGTNDAYAIIQVGKDKFSTSVAEKCVSPEWKEEATFDLPPNYQGDAERCTLYIIAMHRALVGLDKFLGQAVINLVDLHANRSRKKTDWYKLVDKNGKQEKDRGGVLLDIQFMRNNLTASMFDLSMADKPRSGIGKLKDKIRGKKKEGLSDSASAIVPSSVGIDSEEEGEGGSDNPKKKSKFKSLFGPKTNLQRNVSQSMSTLGTLPEKNSSLSSSRSSGLNVDSPDVKKKFKILGHKRTESSDSKVSLGPFSLLSRSKQNIQEQNNLCINGSHVYAEEQESKANFGSSLSLNSSGKGSVEDVRKYHQRNTSDISIDSLKGLTIPSYKPEVQDKASLVPQRPLEDRSHVEVEEKGKKHEGRSLQEMLDRQEEQEQRRQQERERKQEEERKSRLEEQEKKRKEEEELQRKQREEETQRAEDQLHQEETRVTERLSSLFGIGKKEEKSEEALNEPKHLDVPASTKPFEDIPLTPDTPSSIPKERSTDPQRAVRTTLTPTPPASAFPSRTAKVSAVKPRLALSVLPETENSHFQSPSDSIDTQTTSHLSPSLSTDPFKFFGMFSDLHSSLAPAKPPRTFSESSMENLSASKSDKKRKAPLPPGHLGGSSKSENNPDNGGQVHTQNSKDRPVLPLPDYETLFPKKRHGVMGQTRWDHLVAEVNQRNWDFSEEMSVDGPERLMPNKSSILKDRTSVNLNQHPKNHEAPPPAPARHKEALLPPRAPVTPEPSVETNDQYGHIKESLYATVNKPRNSASKNLENHPTQAVHSRHVPQDMEGKSLTPDALNHQLSQSKEKPTPTARSIQSINSKIDGVVKEMPLVKPRQESLVKNPVRQVQPDKQVTNQPMTSENNKTEKQHKGQNGNLLKAAESPEELHLGKPATEFEGRGMIALDPFPSDNLLSKDPWALPEHTTNEDDLFPKGPKQMGNLEDQTSTFDKKDKSANKGTNDPFKKSSEKSKSQKSESGNQSPSFTEQARASFKRNFSLRKKNSSRQYTTTVKAGTENTSLARSVSQSSQDAEDVELTVTSVAPPSRTNSTVVTSESPIGGKATLRAWVPPSEAQTVALQNGSGSAVSKSRRPHPVKPMSTESQSSSVIAVGKDPKTITIKEMAEMSKNVDSGPYTQLTQEELITLVVKQQAELSKKDARIMELEDYIDNLLVRVMEEKPAILLSLQSKC